MPTENNNRSLSEYVRRRRLSRGFDHYEAERRSGVDHTTWRKLEAGSLESPSARTLQAVADALEVPAQDLLVLAGYRLSRQLPSFSPYLRARYHLPHEAVADLERYFALLRSHYGIPDDQLVFPPKVKPTQLKASRTARRQAKPKGRAA